MTGSVQACFRHDWQFATDTGPSCTSGIELVERGSSDKDRKHRWSQSKAGTWRALELSSAHWRKCFASEQFIDWRTAPTEHTGSSPSGTAIESHTRFPRDVPTQSRSRRIPGQSWTFGQACGSVGRAALVLFSNHERSPMVQSRPSVL